MGPSTPVATSITLSVTSVTLASIGATHAVTASVLDQHGEPLANATVSWSSERPTVASVSDAGLITATGTGTTRIVAESGDATASVSVVVAGVPTTAMIHTGHEQTAPVGTAVAVKPAVRVVDERGRGVPAVNVRFQVTRGGGRVTGGDAVTNADGVATLGGWTLGTAAGPNEVTAEAEGLPTLTFRAIGVPGPPAQVIVHAGDNQVATVNTALPTAPAVRVRDAFDNAVPGVSVTFAVATGGGVITGAIVTTNAQGVATVGSWTLGTVAGVNVLTASVGSLAPLSITATGQAGAPAQLQKQAGDNQLAQAGTAVAIPPTVAVLDAYGNPVSGARVTFAVASGGGAVSGADAVTDAQGVAAVGGWTLGPLPGVNTLTAALPGGGISGNPLTFTAFGLVPLP